MRLVRVKAEGRGKESEDEKLLEAERLLGRGRERGIQYGIFSLQSAFHIHDAVRSSKKYSVVFREHLHFSDSQIDSRKMGLGLRGR